MKPIRFKILTISSLIFITLLFWYRSQLSMDLDFGIYMGVSNYILELGIPKTDPFSYTMPLYPYIDHEWLSQLIINRIYSLAGYQILALISTLLIVSTLQVTNPKPLKFPHLLAGVLVAASLLSYANIRPQVFSWVFLALLLKVGADDKLWTKYRLFIPPIFILWANLHGGFAGGLITLAIIIFFRLFKDPKQRLTNILLLLLSLVVTAVNPYGLRVWNEVLGTVLDQVGTSATVSEWQPIFTNFQLIPNLAVTIYFIISLTLVFKFLTKIPKVNLAVYFFWLALAITSRRHIPIWLILSLPATYHSLELFLSNLKLTPKTLKKLASGASLAILLVFAIQARSDLQINYMMTEDTLYPINAIKYLTEHQIEGNLFSEFGWGGYLIWKLPEQKVFIDGRMASWGWAIDEYNRVSSGNLDYQPIFEKYHITRVLWPTRYFFRAENIDTSTTDLKNITLEADPLVIKLIGDGWKREYVDFVSFILTAPDKVK